MTGVSLKIVIIIGTLLYYISISSFFAKNSKAMLTVSRVTWWVAWVLNLIIVINNFVLNGYIPFVSMFQVLTFIAMLFGPILLYMQYIKHSGWMWPYFTAAAAILMTGLCFMNADAVTEFRPALQSPWFLPHVLVYAIAYTLGFITFLIELTAVFTKNREKKALLQKGVYDAVCITFTFATLGLFIGAIWANEVWGAFWSWDSKENWALVTWLMYVLYLHFRRNKKLAKFADVFVILAFLAIVITMFFSGSSSHSYL